VPLTSFFKAPSFQDPALGQLVRTRGQWRAAIALGGTTPTPLALFGTAHEPDAAGIAAARQIQGAMDGWRPAIEQALHEHLAPYRAAISDEPASEQRTALMSIERPDQVWAHVSLKSAAIIRMSGGVTTELAYAVAWDEDHTLGARFQSGSLVELCGSIVPA
jgi:hypothetical protein